jgi:hypothetical protein
VLQPGWLWPCRAPANSLAAHPMLSACQPDNSPSLLTTRALSSRPRAMELGGGTKSPEFQADRAAAENCPLAGQNTVRNPSCARLVVLAIVSLAGPQRPEMLARCFACQVCCVCCVCAMDRSLLGLGEGCGVKTQTDQTCIESRSSWHGLF